MATAIGDGGGGPTADVSFNAESGSLAGVSSSTRARTSDQAAKNGSRGLRLSSTNAPSYARWDRNAVPQGHAFAVARTWVRVHSREPGQSVDLLTIANQQGSRNFDFFVAGDTGRFKWDVYRYHADESSFVPTPGRWYYVEVRLEYSGTQHTAEVRIDGAHQGAVVSPGSDTNVSTVSVGAYSAKTHTQDYDDLAVAVGDETLSWLPAPGVGAPSSVEVTWNPVVDSGSGLREYSIWRNGQWYGWVPAGTTRFVDPSPIAGAAYQVRAIDNDLNRSGWSTPVEVTEPASDTTPPPTPQDLLIQANGDGTATLSWSSVVDQGGSGLREYGIFRNGSWYGWVPDPTSEYVDPEPITGATYRVRAYDHALNRSGFSSPATL